ncbi:MAG: glucose-6-phosphate isomerase, partial [Gammaproteobacteria bacterium]|nr:glucose-6-phosphate isomerase [Gammaproteobacteria bacterium]
MSVLRESVAWKKLESHYRTMQAVHLRELFAQDEVRAARYTVEAAGWRLDYSKHRVNEATLKLLFDLARARGLEARRDAMFAGEKVNTTE